MRASFIPLPHAIPYLALPLALALALIGCSGATQPLVEPNDDGGTVHPGDSGTAPDSGAPAPDSGNGVDSGPDCPALLVQLQQLQAKAQQCCAQCDSVQCVSAVDGMCCPISVSVATSPETQAFEAALAQYKLSCPYGCPAIACQKAPSGVCSNSGTCQ